MIKDWLAKQKAKAMLLKVFKDGDIGIHYSYGQNKGMVYPKIRSVRFDYDNRAVIYSFSLPTGLDPKEVKKKEFCFKQVFGKNIELKGEIKEFKLTVYAASLPGELTYDYEMYSEQFRGMKLPIVAGLDLNGNIIVFDLVKNPHLLIAGETGSGKSTQLRSVLSTLIQALPPDRLELYLSDLKRSEFHVFR
ncbi:FtsK/SpoIIIE domain-containing protein, partial [Bacillus sp. JJ1122]|uniref:FtsK/SpoIIIE domain-containing protein n=1 Tax=Bacillus sp. JJ1122 TaxID=3122951 RepID=UPI002FFDDC57